MLQLMIHLTVQSRGATECTFDGATKNVLRDLHKDAQKGACEVALKCAFEVAPVVSLVDIMIDAQMCTKWFI